MMENNPFDNSGAGGDASSRFLEQLTQRSVRVRHYLWNHRPLKARKDLREANRDAEFLEKQVVRLHRSLLALEQHLSSLDDLTEDERRAMGMVTDGLIDLDQGHWESALESFRSAISDLSESGGRVNPFLVGRFFLTVEARWPAEMEHGLLLLTIENLGTDLLPPFRLAAPAPPDWIAEPKAAEVPAIPPGGFIEMGIKIHPTGTISENLVLAKRVSIVTGYLADMGDLTVSTRIENRTLKSLEGFVVDAWLPRGFTARRLPFIQNLAPGEVIHINTEIDAR
ncbi:MAG TPA: hypothetical protein HA345_01200 [Candidatus Thalassarchaeaceae archaeon]|nr:MAG TPA: hypothetical protein D7H94_01190 [Candidatus Poseidoniales archaeon]HIH84003.1 hypothetical protein [Candidatus Thalassarchaeaceae archaeon]